MMTLCLQQEVNLSRRACWPSRDFRDNSDNTVKNNNKISNGNDDDDGNFSQMNSFTVIEKNEDDGDNNNEFSNGAKNIRRKNQCITMTSKKNCSRTPVRSDLFSELGHCVMIQNERKTTTTTTEPPTRMLSNRTTNTTTRSPFFLLLDIRRCRSLMFLVLMACVLLTQCSSFAAARPNMTAGPPGVVGDTGAPVSASSSMEPLDSLSTVEPAHDNGHKSEKAHDQHPERYPVFTADFLRVELPFIIGIWIIFASIAKIGFHMAPKLNKIFPESCLLIVIGVVVGIILYYATSIRVQPLTPNTFFFYMLPPIILDAGYFMPNRLFFDNLGTILLMAVVGTIFNISTIGVSLYAIGRTGFFGFETPLMHMLLFASLISAVDPVAVLAVFEEIHVNEVLYIVVFGESLLNDAVTVVLYHMFEVYGEMEKVEIVDYVSGGANFLVVALGGTIIGVFWGFLTGLVTRFTDQVRVIEPIFVFVMAYLSYLSAEAFHMSGILAITFCGMSMKNYVEANISHKSHTTIKYALKMIASSSETIIFMFLGVATVQNEHDFNIPFIVLTILFCTVFRVLGVLLLVNIANRFRIQKLSNVDQFVMSYGGLRGAIAFALVMLINTEHVPSQPMLLTATIAVIYFTVFLQGITIKPLVRILNVKRAEKRKPTMNERIHERFIDHMMAGMEDIIGKTGNYNVRDKFKRFDVKFIRPLLIRDFQGAEPKIFETYSKLTMKDAMEFMKRNQSNAGGLSNTDSMSALFRNYTAFFGGSPSFSNLDAATRNLDMQELDYNPSKKDLTDARIHHLLAEELKPYRRASFSHRRLSYSRHAVDDRDLSTQVNYKMPLNIRRMVCDRKHHKRSKRGNKENPKAPHVSFPEFQQNGSAKQFANDYLNEVLHEEHEEEDVQKDPSPQNDDWDSGLTFTAKTSPEDGDADTLPEDPKRFSKDLEGEQRVATPTATETTLPWKRGYDDDDEGGIKQHEFPSWVSNKEYLAYHSPSATFLGGLAKPKQAKSVIGLFRRESSTTSGGGMDSDASSTPLAGTPTIGGRAQADKRSASICGPLPLFSETDPLGAMRPHHAGQFPVTASHRRNNRRASMLEMSGGTIPEEQSCRTPLFERNEQRDGSLDRRGGGGVNGRYDYGGGHRATLAKARRAQNKRSISLGAEAALLSPGATDSDLEESNVEDDDGYDEGGGGGL